MTLEWRYRALVLRLLAEILVRLVEKTSNEVGHPLAYKAHEMLDEFRRNA